ncbi:MAG: ComEC/Rec2 family competence protein, partial [Oscillospiraceae bacterium]|nr:ComEC/Rec2 family competence protein [Oscillospiraceae bacterium]
MRKLAWACGSFAAGVFLAVLLVPTSFLPWLAGGFVVLGFCGTALRGRRRLRLMLLGFAAAAGILAAAAQERLLLAPAERLVGGERTVHCRVLEYPDVYEDYARVYVRLTEPGLPRVQCMLMDYNGDVETLRPGDELRCALRFRSARIRYGEESDMYTSRGVFLRATLLSPPEVTGRSGFSLPQELRRFVRERSLALFPADCAPFHTSLLSGDKTALYNDLDNYYALSRAGLMHITAVSGMHVSFLVGFVLLLFPDRRRSAALLLPGLALFAAVTGFTPSVMRAVFMQLCLLLAPLVKRESDPLTSLLLILAILLAVNPQAAGSVSLQLSFAATLGIVLFSTTIFAHLRERLLRLGRQTASFLAASAATSLGALAFVTPLTALHFGYVSLVAPLSNVLCLWLISALFVGGYVVLALSLLWYRAGAFMAGLLAWGDRLLLQLARFCAALPNAALYTDSAAVCLWLGFLYVLIFVAWLHYRKSGEVRLTATCLLAVLTLCMTLLGTHLSHRELRLTVLDVGQGSCTLVEGGRSAVMVDCGGSYTDSYPGEVAANYLASRQRSRLDALILTHLHADHINGVERLLALTKVERIYLPEWPKDERHLALRMLAKRQGIELCYVTEDIQLTADGWELEITAPL